jgi:hypothetical protein
MKATFQERTRDEIDVSEWGLDSIDQIRDGLDRIVNEFLQSAICQPAEMSLPFIWSRDSEGSPGPDGEVGQIDPGSDGEFGPPVTDPLTLRIMLPLGSEEGGGPSWRVSFSELMLEEIGTMTGQWSGADDDHNILLAWRGELMKLVDAIDDRIAENKKGPHDGEP